MWPEGLYLVSSTRPPSQSDIVNSNLSTSSNPPLGLEQHLHAHTSVIISFTNSAQQQIWVMYVSLTLSRECVVKVTCVCLQPCPPVLLQRAGPYLQQQKVLQRRLQQELTVVALWLEYLWSRPFFLTNSCSTPTWCPVNQWEKERHRSPWLQEGTTWMASRAPRMLVCPAFSSGTDRYHPPETHTIIRAETELKLILLFTGNASCQSDILTMTWKRVCVCVCVCYLQDFEPSPSVDLPHCQTSSHRVCDWSCNGAPRPLRSKKGNRNATKVTSWGKFDMTL